MRAEKEKMLAGGLYNALDPQLSAERLYARKLIKAINAADESDVEEMTRLLYLLLPNAGQGLWLQPPFYCDYGYNMYLGEKVFFNFNCVVLDVCKVTIGSRTLCGPNVQIYTATHPTDAVERASGLEFAKPITIGEDVWLGGSSVICPGVNIGNGTIIGAGSVVTKNIPDGVFAAGNPCKIIRQL